MAHYHWPLREKQKGRGFIGQGINSKVSVELFNSGGVNSSGKDMTVSEVANGAQAKRPPEESQRVFPVKVESESESEVELGSNITGNELLDFLKAQQDEIATSSLGDQFYDSLQDLKRKNRQSLCGDIRSWNSLSDITLDSSTDEKNHYSFLQSCSKPKSASAIGISSFTIPQPFKMTLRETHQRPQFLKSQALLEKESTAYKRQLQEAAECQKQFRAQPVPAHIYLPLYQEIMEKNEIQTNGNSKKKGAPCFNAKTLQLSDKRREEKRGHQTAVSEHFNPS
ncbi:hypothetical protein E2320_021459 [Naja naja]|nr:hypothetical protein E2320_021459 [Naja naja]